MQVLLENFGVDYPDHVPILGYQLLSTGPNRRSKAQALSQGRDVSALLLPMLLAKVLLAFAFEFERQAGLSLAISANVLRLTSLEGVRVGDLPRLSGVSKEAIAMCLDRLEERGLAVLRPESREAG